MQPETHGTHARSAITMACTGAAVAGQTKITIHRRRPGDAHRSSRQEARKRERRV